MSNSRERGERAKLWLVEHVVELRWSTTERAGRAVWTVVPEQLQERVVVDFGATDRFRRDKSVSRLCRRQRSVSPPIRHEREEVVEERNVGNRSDFAACIRVLHERVDRVVVA